MIDVAPKSLTDFEALPQEGPAKRSSKGTLLALPLMAAGLRTSAVQVVATATLAAYVGGGGLGQFINEGFARGDQAETAAGGVLVAALALLVELLLALLQRQLEPPVETRL